MWTAGPYFSVYHVKNYKGSNSDTIIIDIIASYRLNDPTCSLTVVHNVQCVHCLEKYKLEDTQHKITTVNVFDIHDYEFLEDLWYRGTYQNIVKNIYILYILNQ